MYGTIMGNFYFIHSFIYLPFSKVSTMNKNYCYNKKNLLRKNKQKNN